MRGDEVVVVRVLRRQRAGELLEGVFGVADAQVAGLLERGDGFGDARGGELVGRDVEVVDGVVDELRWC